jgi:8-oxo-dGTP pyrophosphatase MutT (NUDIX family)
MGTHTILNYEEELVIRTDGQTWITSWHPPISVPSGTSHGSAGICVTDTNEIVLISSDGIHWDLPAGRPEGDETWEQTLRREVYEEACATVVDAKLLGFCHSRCIAGHEEELVLLRSFWRAQIILHGWEPAFETTHRRVVSETDILLHLSPVFAPVFRRALAEAAVL